MVLCQLWSDIHLEFYDGRLGKARDKLVTKLLSYGKGKYLFLAGGIANNVKPLTKFLTRLSYEGPWDRIFFVMGNHEYYGNKVRLFSDKESYQSIDVYKVTCLHHRLVELPEFTVCGATLWTNPSFTAYQEMKDQVNIVGKHGPLTKGEDFP